MASKLIAVFVALCALHAITAYQPVSSDPLVAAKLQIQNQIRNINMQININNRNLGLQIQPIRTSNIMTLKALIQEMEASPLQCVATNLNDANSIWPLIDNLDRCRFNEKYEIIRSNVMPILNQLLGDADRAIRGCKLVTDYAGCAGNAAAGIADTADKATADALNEIAAVAGESEECLANAKADLEGRIAALSNNWETCKAN